MPIRDIIRGSNLPLRIQLHFSTVCGVQSHVAQYPNLYFQRFNEVNNCFISFELCVSVNRVVLAHGYFENVRFADSSCGLHTYEYVVACYRIYV